MRYAYMYMYMQIYGHVHLHYTYVYIALYVRVALFMNIHNEKKRACLISFRAYSYQGQPHLICKLQDGQRVEGVILIHQLQAG